MTLPRGVYLASASSLALGLFFLFVWSPLPWGWYGIDFYHDRAARLARGQPFDTTDVPWGYAHYVALFYRLFGPHVWIPLAAQVVLNAFTPVLLYRLALPLTDRPTATLAAILTGVFSFNTVYTSTLSSDAVCTVLFLAALLLFERGRANARPWLFALSGLVAGLATQFRPNLILFPLVLTVIHLVTRPRAPRKLVDVAVYLGLAAAALAPWTLRNYVLTDRFLPTSTHGGIQLWYGTLQTGEYLESRAYNPRSAFESPSFDYTSLEHVPIVVTASPAPCAAWNRASLSLVFWTDRDPRRVRLAPRARETEAFVFDLPGQAAPTTIYYYFESRWPAERDGPESLFMPSGGPSDPFVYFVATRHTSDLDSHHDLLDVFDLIRLLRAIAWNESIPNAPLLDRDRDDKISELDLRNVVTTLVQIVDPHAVGDSLSGVDVSPAAATIRLRNGSSLTVPRESAGLITDLDVRGDLAGKLLYARRSFAGLAAGAAGGASPAVDSCREIQAVEVNNVFYRREPHLMQRYTALAIDNIRRDPWAYAAACVYRTFRLFVIRGSSDRLTAQQFTASSVVYALAFAASLAFFVVFLTGVWLSWRRGDRLMLLLPPIIYVPLTICFVLTNMRYTVTVQPLMFVFVAVALSRVRSPSWRLD